MSFSLTQPILQSSFCATGWAPSAHHLLLVSAGTLSGSIDFCRTFCVSPLHVPSALLYVSIPVCGIWLDGRNTDHGLTWLQRKWFQTLNPLYTCLCQTIWCPLFFWCKWMTFTFRLGWINDVVEDADKSWSTDINPPIRSIFIKKNKKKQMSELHESLTWATRE